MPFAQKILVLLLSTLPYFIHTDQPTAYLFAHGLAGTHKQAYAYARGTTEISDRYIIDNPFITFDFPDATQQFWRVNPHHTSLSQYNEIVCLADSMKRGLSKLNNPADVILVGLSRGASTALNFMAVYNPPQVKALILESPFDSIPSIVDGLVKRTGLTSLPGIHTFIHHSMRAIFSRYDMHEIQPIDLVHRIRSDIPILIICSQADRLVPAVSSRALYKKLKETGHIHAHILVLPQGKHGQILAGQHGQDYCNVVHAFYKKYKMPHNGTFALRGEALLKTCQP